MLQPRSVVGDMIFGVVLSAAQLSILKKHLQMMEDGNAIINETVVTVLEQKCKDIYSKYMPMRIHSNRTEYNTIIDYAVRQDLWEEDCPISKGRLQERRVSYGILAKRLSKKEMEYLGMTGTPQEYQSDTCIAELIQPETCGLTAECRYIMTNTEQVHGYPLTHRLLYYLFVKRLGCEKFTKFGNLQKKIEDLCSDILEEMYYLIELGIPPIFRDLFLEQISLCGIEGFAEFLNPYIIEWAIQQQLPNGCFTDNKEKIMLEHQNRIKREDGLLDEGCTMHITGMAAIYLSINIRAIVEYWSVQNEYSSSKWSYIFIPEFLKYPLLLKFLNIVVVVVFKCSEALDLSPFACGLPNNIQQFGMVFQLFSEDQRRTSSDPCSFISAEHQVILVHLIVIKKTS
ncbi:hypothetical protein L9F63_005805 [Diploptera punctata]|uniref:Uncharacterized protein n=1 Tax=Diploptera punctata TaxID=6984 RepID=A0AAD8E539_DIPPU|nr:hypothetical protein L9F63_005805 [Diploptera punctata]